MYLFVFSILIVLFQYVNAKRVFEDMNNKLGNYKTLSEKHKDSITVLQNDFLEVSHFNLERNEDAIYQKFILIVEPKPC